jgi:hypothetical protein
MEQPDYTVFSQLYHKAYTHCFKKPLQEPISETESKLFYNQILEQTGLAIGWRSLKNYSFYVLNPSADRQENPSVATLDTLARYVLKAPNTDDISRKKNEAHHPYWFLYKSRYMEATGVKNKKRRQVSVKALLILVVLVAGLAFYMRHQDQVSFTDNFENLDEQVMRSKGWYILNKDAKYWEKRNSHPKSLTLFTLPGDNWPDSTNKPLIKNLLIRGIPKNSFSVELQMENFIPNGEWQQAGLLLLADSTLNSPSIRVSVAYNDFFGGYQWPGEIIVQAISSPGENEKPEEFIHYRVLTPDSAAAKPVLFGNLKHTALRIEKQGNHYRFLYAGGFTMDEAFKELASKDLILEPRYVAIFALKGRVSNTPVIPVVIKKFIFHTINSH